MKELTSMATSDVQGGLSAINLGVTLAGLPLAAATGGVGTLGMALCAVVAAQGINEMEKMANEQFMQGTHEPWRR